MCILDKRTSVGRIAFVLELVYYLEIFFVALLLFRCIHAG